MNKLSKYSVIHYLSEIYNKIDKVVEEFFKNEFNPEYSSHILKNNLITCNTVIYVDFRFIFACPNFANAQSGSFTKISYKLISKRSALNFYLYTSASPV